MRVWVSDAEAGGTHGANVKSAISTGYGSDISNEINLVESAEYSVAQVKADMLLAYNAGYELFVSSAYSGANFLTEAKTYYPDMLCVFPNGVNDHVSYQLGSSYTIPEIAVITGAGDDNNETGYPIEFFDVDPTETDASSFSNGVVAGKLLKIKDGRGSHWTDAVQAARATSSLSTLDTEDGYGVIDVSSAVAYSGTVQLTVGDITASRTSGMSVSITLERVIDATNYKIYRKEQDETDWTLISTQTGLTYTDTIGHGVYAYKYIAYNDNLTSSYSSEIQIKYGASPIYEIKTDTYTSDSSEGFLIYTEPFILVVNDNLIFSKQYQVNFNANEQGIKFNHSGSSLEFTEIENKEVFTARGKIIAFELPKNKTIEFNQFNLVEA